MITKRKIINILKKYEDKLSDGFRYYSDNDEGIKVVAEAIMKKVNKKWIKKKKNYKDC